MLNFGNERAAVETMLTLKLSGNTNTDYQGYSTLHLFDTAEIKKIARNTLQYIWGWFTDIGMFMSGLIGVYAAFKTLKYLLGVIINGLAIYKTVGCGLQLLASIWNTLAVWIVHKYQAEHRHTDVEAQLNEPQNQPTCASTSTLAHHTQRPNTVEASTTSLAPTYPNIDHWTSTMTSS